MKFTQFLREENIQQAVIASSKKRVLELIGKQIADTLNAQLPPEQALCAIECFTRLFKREKLGSTGLNHGVALPHAKLPENEALSLTEPIAVFLQLETPIHYEAVDNKEVDLIYAIMFPEERCMQYKSCLQQLAQQLSDKNLLKQLRAAKSAQEIWQIFEYADGKSSLEDNQ